MSSTKQKAKAEKFKKEIMRCLLLPKNERAFWFKKADNLPEIVLDDLLGKVEENNKSTDSYLAKAFENDKEKKYLTALKKIYTDTKNQIVRDNENEERKIAEEKLQKQLIKN